MEFCKGESLWRKSAGIADVTVTLTKLFHHNSPMWTLYFKGASLFWNEAPFLWRGALDFWTKSCPQGAVKKQQQGWQNWMAKMPPSCSRDNGRCSHRGRYALAGSHFAHGYFCLWWPSCPSSENSSRAIALPAC